MLMRTASLTWSSLTGKRCAFSVEKRGEFPISRRGSRPWLQQQRIWCSPTSTWREIWIYCWPAARVRYNSHSM